MTAYQAGTAYVEIMPAITGLNSAIRRQLNGQLAGVGGEVGRRIGGNIGGGIEGGITPAMTRMQRIVGASLGLLSRFGGPLGRVRDGFNSSAAAASAFSGKAGTIGGVLRKIASGADAVGYGMSRMGAVIASATKNARAEISATSTEWAKSVTRMAPRLFAGGIIAVGGAMIYAGAQIEQTHKTLIGLYGSTQQANFMMGKLKQLASNSPIDYQSFAMAASNLAYMGIKGNDAVKIMRNVSQAVIAVGGGADNMQRVSSAMLTLVNQGKVTVDVLDQISDAGVPIFSALAAHFHTTIAQVRDMVTQGKVQISDVMDSIENAEGKNFAQMKAAAASTSTSLQNRFLTAKNRIMIALGEVGKSLAPTLGPALTTVGNKVAQTIGRIPAIVNRIKQGMNRSGVTAAFRAMAGAASALWRGLKPFLGGALSGFTSALGGAARAAGGLSPILTKVGNWLSSHPGVAHAMGTAVGFLSGAMVTLRIAMWAATAASTAWKLAMGGMAPIRTAAQIIKGVTLAIQGQTLAEKSSIATTNAFKAAQAVQGVVAAATAAIQGQTLATDAGIGAKIAYNVVQGIQTALQWAFNSALWASVAAQFAAYAPLILIIAAIAALVVGIYFLVTNWTTVWNAICAAAMWVWNTILHPMFTGIWIAIQAVGTAAVWLWQNILSPAFNGIALVAKWMFAILVTIVFTPLYLLWTYVIAPAALWLWHNVLQPVFAGIGAAAQWMYYNILLPVFNALIWVWNNVIAPAAMWLWHNVFQPIWNGIGAAVSWVYYNILLPLWIGLKYEWNLLSIALNWLWHNVFQPIWNGIGAAVRWVHDNVLVPIWMGLQREWNVLAAALNWFYHNIVQPVWNGIGNAIRWVWRNVISPAWEGMKAGVAAIGRAFQSGVDFIQRVWNRIKAIAAKPVNFVINTVYNNGIKAVWDKVAGFLGLPKLPKANPVKFATGGQVPGTGNRDTVAAMLTPGEMVIRKKVAERHRNFLAALNDGQAEAVTAAGGHYAHMPGYNQGGIVANTGSAVNAAIQRGLDFARKQAGKPYIWGGVGPRGYDCSGLMSAVTNVLRNQNPHHRLGVARSQPWPGFVRGLKSAWATGFNATHTAGTLAGTNIESAQTPIVFPGKHGADASEFSGHASLPVVGGQFVSGGSGGGGFIAWIVNKILSPVRGLIQKMLPANPLWEGAMRGMALKIVDGVSSWLIGQDNSGEGAPGTGPVADQVRGVANGYGWGNGPEWDALSWIISHESGWNPGIKNAHSSAFGLFQMTDGTWAAYGGGAKTTNPAQQARIGLKYIKDRYGDPLGAKAFWQAHHWYDNGGILHPGATLAYNGTGKPEHVLTDEDYHDLVQGKTGGIGPFYVQLPEKATVSDLVDETMFTFRHASKSVHA